MRERARRFTCLHIAKEPSSNGYLSAYISSEEMDFDAKINKIFQTTSYLQGKITQNGRKPCFAEFRFVWQMLGKRGRNPCGNMDIIYSFSVYWHQCTSLPKRWTFLYIPPAPHSRPHIAQYATSLEQGKPHPQETSRAYYLNVYLWGNIIPWSRNCQRRIKSVIHLANEQLATCHALNRAF